MMAVCHIDMFSSSQLGGKSIMQRKFANLTDHISLTVGCWSLVRVYILMQYEIGTERGC